MKNLLYFLSILLIIYLVWANLGKGFEKTQSLNIDSFETFGDSLGKGNLVGIQAFMEAGDYATENRFHQKIQFYFEQAHQKGWLVPYKSVVVFPEYIGTWLVTADEKTSVYEAKNIQDGMTTMVLSNAFTFAKNYFFAPSEVSDKVKFAVFAMKNEKMAEIYQNVFSDLAKKYKVTVVAGSILLQNPEVKNGELKTQNGQLFNTSVVFRPDGEIAKELVKKTFPTSDEQPFVCAADAANIPVFDTPVGKMGVLVCADAWFAASYRTLKEKGAEFVVTPSYSSGYGLWNKPWNGYSGAETPADAKADVGKISLGEAWQKHAMAMRANKQAGIKKGINVFLQGNLWDLGTDGTTIILSDSTAKTTKKFGGSTIINLWL